jgi:hypothetical protein
VIRRGFDPSGATVQMSSRLPSVANMIELPSGDQAGSRTSGFMRVTRCWPLPSAFMIQISCPRM